MEEQLDYLKKMKFEKRLQKLNKKLKNKKVVVYGSGILFQAILKNYDLSNLNIIGISDRKYTLEDDGKEDLGYKIIPLSKLAISEADYVLVATLKFIDIIYNFQEDVLRNTGIKVLPLVDKPFITLLKEIFA